jgi:DNA adenine methylase
MNYPGGKSGAGVYQTLINLIPPHTCYVEPFLGGGAIMRLKRPAFRSYGIDSDLFTIGGWAHHKVPGLIVECGDGIKWLRRNDTITPQTFVYCDPPYLMSVRSSKRPMYRHEMTDKQHLELLAVLRMLPCMVMVTSYPNALYEQALAGWSTVTFESMTRNASQRTDQVWMNYTTPTRLHDYRFLGEDYRERERIKRLLRRWKQRTAVMNPLQRMALLSLLNEGAAAEAATNRLKAVNPLPAGAPKLKARPALDPRTWTL